MDDSNKLAYLRGQYEKKMHDLIFSNWILPYSRSNQRCKVVVYIDKSGLITGHEFISGCADNYRTSITRAIRKTNRVPVSDNKVYKSKEIFNFNDGTKGSLVY